MREAQAMGQVTHPRIISIFDIGEHTNADGSRQAYLVPELVAGGDIKGLVEGPRAGCCWRARCALANGRLVETWAAAVAGRR